MAQGRPARGPSPDPQELLRDQHRRVHEGDHEGRQGSARHLAPGGRGRPEDPPRPLPRGAPAPRAAVGGRLEEPKFRDLVFPSLAGTPISHNNLNKQHFKSLLEKAGLPDMRPYDLRHTFATLWIESGESAEVLQKILGHLSITLAINTYSHLSPRYQRESFGRLGESFGRPRNDLSEGGS